MDYLSYLTVLRQQQGIDTPKASVIVLNSTSLRARALPVLSQCAFSRLFCFLDNDEAGRSTLDYFQMALATLGFVEVLRRFLSSSETPLFQWMIIVSIFALIGNLVSLWLINKAKSKEAHMQASAIFTSNDIIVNGGVILAGVLVYFLDSKWPDLVIGGIVFAFVMRGAIRILKLSK